MEQNTTLSIFEGRQIRKAWHKDEWWFSVVDIVEDLNQQKLKKPPKTKLGASDKNDIRYTQAD